MQGKPHLGTSNQTAKNQQENVKSISLTLPPPPTPRKDTLETGEQ